MKYIRTFESYRGVKKKLASVNPEIFKQAINESVLQVGDLYKVRSMVDIPQSLINSYVKKEKDTTGRNLRQFFGDVEIAELLLQYITTAGLDLDKIPTGALTGQSQAQTQTQVQPQGQEQTQTQVQPQGQEQTQGQEQAQPQGQEQAQSQGQEQAQPQGQEQAQPQGQSQEGDFEEPQAQGQGQEQAQPQSQGQGQTQTQGQVQGQEEEEEKEEGNEELPA